MRTIVCWGRCRVPLLRKLCLSLVYDLLLLLVLVFRVLGLLARRYRPLMREAVKYAEDQRRPPENLVLTQLAMCRIFWGFPGRKSCGATVTSC